MEILDGLQFGFILIELLVLVFTLMEKDLKRKLVLIKWVIGLCASVSGLYLLDAVINPEGRGVAIFLMVLWGGCVYVWNRSHKSTKLLIEINEALDM